MSRIVLNEHYQLSPQIVPSEQPAISGSESGLIFSAQDGPPSGSQCILDLGEEWFELTGYPMVWGLFASTKGNHLLRAESSLETVLGAFKVSSERDGADSDDPTTDEFYSGDMRVGYDDLVTASLTDLAQYLYFYDVLEEPTAVPVVSSDEFE